MSGIIAIRSGNERDLKAAVTYAGPVTAAVDARQSGFRVRNTHSCIKLLTMLILVLLKWGV